jgi:hypothetical protein
MAGHRWMGYVVWAILLGALFAWEGIGLRGEGFPTLSDAGRAVMRSPVGRWALFALWLWFGWHLFVRGWHFLLRGPVTDVPQGAQQPDPSGGTGPLLRHEALPLLTGYLTAMAILAAGWRTTHRSRAAGNGYSDVGGSIVWPSLIRQVLGTVAGGFALLMAVVLAYYYAVAGESWHFLLSVLTGGALLTALALPVFLLASWTLEHSRERRGRRRRRGRDGRPA